MLPPHLRHGRNRRQPRRPTPSSQSEDSEGPDQATGSETEAHFPRTPQDVYSAIETLRRASAGRLTDELLKPILFHAEYDSVHFKSTSNKQSSRHSSGPETEPESYIETDTLMWLGDFDVVQSDGLSVQKCNGRLRSVRLEATGRDQGWVGDPTGGAWSWFEIGRDHGERGHLARRGWKWNAIGSMNLQDHSTFYHVDEELSDADPELSTWLSTLQSGERLSIIPMARFGGWSCNVTKGTIDVEIEVWR